MGNQEEEKYYPKVKGALENYLTNIGFSCDFEVIGRKKSLVRRFLPKNSKLLRDVRALPPPDIMGFIWSRPQQKHKLVIAEFKLSPKFMDIFQAKGYDELFDSDLTFLLSVKSISESSKISVGTIDFIRNNPDLLRTKLGRSVIYIKFLNETCDGDITLAVRGDEIDLPDEHEKLLKLLSSEE